MYKSKILLTAAGEWWAWALGVTSAALGLGAAYRQWRSGALARAQEENRALRSENSKLVREALIRNDDLQECYRQIDELQVKIIAQRERQQRFIDLEDKHPTQP